MKSRNVLLTACLLGVLALSSAASAETIAAFTGALAAGDPTQLGRLSRNGIPQDWTGGEPYPGVVNPTTTYTYHEYIISAATLAQTPYLQISFDDALTNVFISAYEGSYDPNNKATNWLGDPGTSGNYFGTDPLFFQVIADPTQNLILVVNSTLPAGIGEQFGVVVDGFIDTDFNDPAPVPEPSSLVLLGSGLVGVVETVRRRLKTA